jgi:hypothetical protein
MERGTRLLFPYQSRYLFPRNAPAIREKPACGHAPSSPSKNHLLLKETLGGLVVVGQRLGFAEAVPLVIIQALDVRHAVSPQAWKL